MLTPRFGAMGRSLSGTSTRLHHRPSIALSIAQIPSSPPPSRRHLSSVTADFYRGGTSKALFFQPSDLPSDTTARHALFRSAMGSPDPYGRQLDGMGGGISSTSKICLVQRSGRSDADVDYTFVQIGVKDEQVDYASNCGNMVAAVGPYALEKGLAAAKSGGSEDTALVRIYNTNTKKIIHSRFRVDSNGRPVYSGDYAIDGVSGTAAKISLAFVQPGGSRTGKLLPTGQARETMHLSSTDNRSIDVSLVDCANPCVYVRAGDFGMTGDELPDAVLARPDLVAQLEEVRQRAGVAMGFFTDLAEAAASRSVPKVCIVSSPRDHVTLSGKPVRAQGVDVMVRVMSSGDPHRAIPITAAVNMAVASKVPGSLVHEVVTASNTEEITIAHASGTMGVEAQVSVDAVTGAVVAESGTILRTARKLFEGQVFY